MPRRLLWIALWITSIVATAQYVTAQRSPDPTAILTAPIMATGDDLAFRVQSYGQDAARGQLMVRVNGIWFPADFVEHPNSER